MMPKAILARLALAGSIAVALAANPAFADKDDHSKGKGWGKGRSSEGDQGHDRDRRGHFEERHRVVVHDYYVKEYDRGRCPPGLAKKHNGCMPPGQAKKWRMGRPLPPEVVYYSVPPSLVVQIGAAPPGYKYVRVASDILMIAVGTGLVVDAINDLGRM